MNADNINFSQARTIIRNIAKHGCLKWSSHCRSRMRTRNVTADDFLYVLMWGKIVNIQENPEHSNYQCEIKGKDLDGVDLTLHVAVIEEENSLLCITVHI